MPERSIAHCGVCGEGEGWEDSRVMRGGDVRTMHGPHTAAFGGSVVRCELLFERGCAVESLGVPSALLRKVGGVGRDAVISLRASLHVTCLMIKASVSTRDT